MALMAQCHSLHALLEDSEWRNGAAPNTCTTDAMQDARRRPDTDRLLASRCVQERAAEMGIALPASVMAAAAARILLMQPPAAGPLAAAAAAKAARPPSGKASPRVVSRGTSSKQLIPPREPMQSPIWRATTCAHTQQTLGAAMQRCSTVAGGSSPGSMPLPVCCCTRQLLGSVVLIGRLPDKCCTQKQHQNIVVSCKTWQAAASMQSIFTRSLPTTCLSRSHPQCPLQPSSVL